jgi:hypothetical protein
LQFFKDVGKDNDDTTFSQNAICTQNNRTETCAYSSITSESVANLGGVRGIASASSYFSCPSFRDIYWEIEMVFINSGFDMIRLWDDSKYRLFRDSRTLNPQIRSVLLNALINDEVKSYYEAFGFKFSVCCNFLYKNQ